MSLLYKPYQAYIPTPQDELEQLLQAASIRAAWLAAPPIVFIPRPPVNRENARIEHAPSHTAPIFDAANMPKIVRWAQGVLVKQEIDAMVAVGHSGLLIAGALQYLTGIPVFAVRKPGERSVAAGDSQVTGIAPHGKAKRWAWVDDLISSGSTFWRARKIVEMAGLIREPLPAITLLYAASDRREGYVMNVEKQSIRSVFEGYGADVDKQAKDYIPLFRYSGQVHDDDYEE